LIVTLLLDSTEVNSAIVFRADIEDVFVGQPDAELQGVQGLLDSGFVGVRVVDELIGILAERIYCSWWKGVVY